MRFVSESSLTLDLTLDSRTFRVLLILPRTGHFPLSWVLIYTSAILLDRPFQRLFGTQIPTKSNTPTGLAARTCPGYQPGSSLALIRRLKLLLLGPIEGFDLLDLIPVSPLL